MSLIPRDNPVRQCYDLTQTQRLMRASSARTVVDLVVNEDPYFVYERAVSASI